MNEHIVQGVPKNALSECYWSHSALTQSRSSQQPLCLEIKFCSFLTKTKQDQALQVMYMVKFGPTVINFGYDFFL